MVSHTAQPNRLRLEHIEEAARVIDPVFRDTPQFLAESLGAELGVRLVCKVETANPLRSFKGRGADYFVHRLRGAAAGPLVCASAGNFGQGLAYAGRRRGLRVEVFAAEGASESKVEQMLRFGARVHLVGRDFDEAKAAARAYAARSGARFVEDGADAAIAEGAGTIGLELGRWPEAFDAALVPLGNGALLAGVARALKARRPGVRVVGVCAAGAPAMAHAWQTGEPRAAARAETVADGIAVRVPVPEAVDDVRALADEVVLVEDDALVAATRLAFDHLGLLVEPAGVAGLAALLAYPGRFAGALVATPLCGGHVAPALARRWLSERPPAWAGRARVEAGGVRP
ncbi:MAG TPA: pyridoxal-phosphate dependent enzyme [Polyangiaceae bacterium]|nr:pyridoxal-phosphate dependent enzyme [Polyangiaceae bacterium]